MRVSTDPENTVNDQDKEKYRRLAKRQNTGQKAGGQKIAGQKARNEKARYEKAGGQKIGRQGAGPQIRKFQKGPGKTRAGKEIHGIFKKTGEEIHKRQKGANAKIRRSARSPKIRAKASAQPVRAICGNLRGNFIRSGGCGVNRRHLWLVAGK